MPHSDRKRALQANSGVFHVHQHFETMLRRESLHHLDAPPVPVHITESARIHQDVEAELLSGAEAAQHLVVLSAMRQTEIDNLPTASLARHLHHLPNLPIRMMGML